MDQGYIQSLKVILLCFEVISGLKVDSSKPELVVVINVRNMRELSNILGCAVSPLPLKCLGSISQSQEYLE